VDTEATLVLVGLSHRTAPVAVRERFVISAEDLPARLRALQAREGAAEAFVLSTCNRTEALLVGPAGRDLGPLVRAELFRDLPDDHVYAFTGLPAAIHFFRVAAGLDSLVLGESEILGQIKRGMEIAQRERTLGPTLQALLQQALHAGKRVRNETPVGEGTLSVARVGVEVAARAFGSFASCDALVIGAGETGVLVAKHLRDLRVRSLAFANRTAARAEEAARGLGASSVPLERLAEAIRRADLVIACVEAGDFAVEPAHFDAKGLRRRDRPLLVIDLSIPRAVDPRVAKLPNVLLYDLDDLARVVSENERVRARAVEGTTEILVTELHKFLAGRTYAALTPAITAMRKRFDAVREEALDAVAGSRADPRSVELANELTKRLLDAALTELKDGVRSARSEVALEREYARFLDHLR
jgi:glutamyl-tRNA reductase